MDFRTLGAVCATILFWSSAFSGIREGLSAYSPGSLALFRFLVASVLLAVYALFTRVQLPRKRDLPVLVFSAFLGITFYHVSLNYGQISVTAGSASFLIGTVPIFSAVLAATLLGERLNAGAWAGIGVSFGGVILITLGEGGGSFLTLNQGALFILASAIATSVFFVLQKPYLRQYGARQFTMYAFWIGTGLLLVFLPNLLEEVQRASMEATLSVLYLGVFPTAISYLMWAYALARAPVSNVTSFMYVSPVLACVIAWLWLGEAPSAVSFAGGMAALTGVALVNRSMRTSSGKAQSS